ncbi:hypothetical protein DIPPA_07120 [Diplonema papillatum]|nr:hypothetical protein DIPPA_07120 [Diplonema papillatum]
MRVMRRKESIIRMDVAMGQVDTWFFKSDGVEDLVNQFHAQHANEFIVDTAGDERDRDGHEGWWVFPRAAERRSAYHRGASVDGQNKRGIAARRAKELHVEFESAFEVLLSEFVSSCGVTIEQFTHVHRLSDIEERESGSHFYRFDEATTYDNFVKTMQHNNASSPTYEPPSAVPDETRSNASSSNNTDDSSMTPAMFLRDLVRRSSEEAKVAYRRKREILPLIDKWDLRSFQQLVDVLHRTECPKPHLSLCERKALARWRNKLTERKPRDHDGVYAAAPVDRDEWARYVAYLTEHFSDKSFSAFLHFIQRCVEADFPTDPESIKRRHTWEAFHSMDLDFRRRVSMDVFSSIASSIPCLQLKESKKIMAKFATEFNNPDGSVSPLDLSSFRDMLTALDKGNSLRTYIELAQNIKEAANKRFK